MEGSKFHFETSSPEKNTTFGCPFWKLGSKVRESVGYNPNIPHWYLGYTHVIPHLQTINPKLQRRDISLSAACLLASLAKQGLAEYPEQIRQLFKSKDIMEDGGTDGSRHA